MSVTAFIGLGSNLGDRAGFLDTALNELKTLPGIRVTAVSRYWNTAPVGGPPDQGNYLNAVAQVETDLPARQLLTMLHAMEDRLGRERQERWGPRTIDLDLLLYGDEQVQEPELQVPHPRMHERTFVLGPLAEIAPNAWHPTLKQRALDLLLQQTVREAPPNLVFAPVQRPGHLLGKRVVVTGSSSGIGRATAQLLAQEGAHVLVHAGKSLAAAEAVRDLIRGMGRQSEVLLADLRDLQATLRFAEQAWQQFGPIDAWINNAGADTLTGEHANLTFDEKLSLLWQIDVRATIHLSRFIGKKMKERGKGVIINVGWDQAETGMEGDSGQLFGTIKAAVMAFTKSLAVSLAPEVRVNCVAPGWIKTAWGEKASDDWQKRATNEAPLRRWGTPEDVAHAIAWMASPGAGFVTGQIIRVNGGVVR